MSKPTIRFNFTAQLSDHTRVGFSYNATDNTIDLNAEYHKRNVPLKLRPQDINAAIVMVNPKKGHLRTLENAGFKIDNNRIVGK